MWRETQTTPSGVLDHILLVNLESSQFFDDVTFTRSKQTIKLGLSEAKWDSGAGNLLLRYRLRKNIRLEFHARIESCSSRYEKSLDNWEEIPEQYLSSEDFAFHCAGWWWHRKGTDFGHTRISQIKQVPGITIRLKVLAKSANGSIVAVGVSGKIRFTARDPTRLFVEKSLKAGIAVRR
ncbi:hypothetical protein HDU97_008574 [Phlyctochytrium planicorne]|nr:hypothetical protein HDU97_008574 [Phlyctochytrium planicorne]